MPREADDEFWPYSKAFNTSADTEVSRTLIGEPQNTAGDIAQYLKETECRATATEAWPKVDEIRETNKAKDMVELQDEIRRQLMPERSSVKRKLDNETGATTRAATKVPGLGFIQALQTQPQQLSKVEQAVLVVIDMFNKTLPITMRVAAIHAVRNESQASIFLIIKPAELKKAWILTEIETMVKHSQPLNHSYHSASSTS